SLIFQEQPDYQPAAIGSIDHINLTIQASSISDVAAYLRENGAEITRGPEEGRAGPTVYVRDPDGYVLEIRVARDRYSEENNVGGVGARTGLISHNGGDMARVALVEEKDHPELAELIGRLRSGRGGQLLNVYRLLLNSPVLAGTWFEHVSAVRWRTELDGLTRELVIIRIGHLTRVKYVLAQHVPNYALQEG